MDNTELNTIFKIQYYINCVFMHTNFDFLSEEFPLLANLAKSAEYNVFSDPVTALFKLRQYGETFVQTLFDEHGIELPREATFHNCLKELEYNGVLPDRVKDLLFAIKNKGNNAVHGNQGSVEDARTISFSAFKIGKWLCETYSVKSTDLSHIKFSPPVEFDTKKALEELEGNYSLLEAKFRKLQAERKAEGISDERAKEINARKIKATSKIEMSEAETRELIDVQLQQAGWEVNTSQLNYKLNKTMPQRGRNMAIAEWKVGHKWADYALFVGTELYGIVEAKKYSQDISTNLRQSKKYSELAEEKEGASLIGQWGNYKVPFLFSTNGRPYLEQIKTKSGIWFLDVRKELNRSKPLRAWYAPEGLVKLWEQDTQSANDRLKDNTPDFLQSKSGLGLRDYQVNAIKAVEDTLINHPEKERALLAMATGTGKTRTIMGLCYRLIQTNRFKRILFLVDRSLLGSQAFDTFTDTKVIDLNTFAEIYEVKGLKDIQPDKDTRVHFATVQGMVKRLFYTNEDGSPPTVDAYDCIIVDEAHRGYLLDREINEDDLNFKDQRDYVSKYRMVLDYFDAFAVGLTATPALHTTEIFGKPVFNYSYREAVIDGYLIDHDPPYIIKTELSEKGIVWQKGEKPKAYDKENNEIVELAELEDELSIEVAGFNKLVLTEKFNRTVVKELVNHLDPESDEKTLIFAATDEHADRVVEYLKDAFSEVGMDLSDNAIQKITGQSYDPEEQVKHFKNERQPNIAVTVDLLTTGIDVPQICNLVFMRRVKSRILYEQMLGRATRRCDDIGKEQFRIYDAVRLYEGLKDYTQMKPVVPNPKTTFKQLVEELDYIDNDERAKAQVEQILAKFQRKSKRINADNEEQFKYHSGGRNQESWTEYLHSIDTKEKSDELNKYSGLWKFLDELKPASSMLMVSEHEDKLVGVERGYGRGTKPEDYIQSFKSFIEENINKIAALQIICTRPKELDRKTLKELRLQLDAAGFNINTLNTAWHNAKNEDIAADIISYIRTLALGSSLVSHEERIKRAVDKVRAMQKWNTMQTKWIDRFEKQLLKETILQKEDLNADPFSGKGGFEKINKIFSNQLDNIIEVINDELYTA
nr:type I restriction-modification system endonuclease [uncultured Carboxylicivirga sp.]